MFTLNIKDERNDTGNTDWLLESVSVKEKNKETEAYSSPVSFVSINTVRS